MEKKQVMLKKNERAELEKFCRKGVRSVRLVSRAKIILALDISGNRTAERQEALAERLGVSRQTIINARRDFLAAESIDKFLQRKKRETPPVPSKINGKLEARIIALACAETPEGCARWTLRLLADKCVELCYVDAISHTAVSNVLKKTNLNLI